MDGGPEGFRKWGCDVWSVNVCLNNKQVKNINTTYLFETLDEAKKYINDKVEKFNHSELPIYIQQKYFKPCKKILSSDGYIIKKDVDYDNSLDKYYNSKGYLIDGNYIKIDRSGTTYHFTKYGGYYLSEKISERCADKLISNGKALWLAKDNKSNLWLTC